jgi:hypothetical protein
MAGMKEARPHREPPDDGETTKGSAGENCWLVGARDTGEKESFTLTLTPAFSPGESETLFPRVGDMAALDWRRFRSSIRDFLGEMPPSRLVHALFLIWATLIVSGCKTAFVSHPSRFSHFIAINDFADFKQTHDNDGQMVLLSPTIQSSIPWNQLMVSWNADAPAGSWLKVEAAGVFPDQTTKFYTLGRWSPDADPGLRTSVRGQRDADGAVNTDTLVLNRLASGAQIRLTLGSSNGIEPKPKFLGLCFSDTKAPATSRPPHRAAWGRTVPTPERSQHGYPGENGWCSPASLSMVLARWAEVMNRPEMNLTVPQVAAAVYDRDYEGTGNWSFNTAFAGGFAGLRSYVTRFDDLSEVEDWIAAGIPVILSARWDLLQPGRPFAPEGHLVVCTGFTKTGDVVVNDPATRLDRGETVRHIYSRDNVIRAWATSHNTVYLVYPTNASIPRDRFGHW